MPTYKEVSKIKTDFISKKEDGINSALVNQQSNLYDTLLSDFIKEASNKIDGKEININKLQTKFKKFYSANFIDIMKQTINASKSLTDLNQMYFATLLDSNKLDEIHNKTKALVDKQLGIDENGKLKQNGFTDKVLGDQQAQKKFIKEVKIILSGNPDINLMQNKLKDFIIGSKNNTGLLESHYRTVSQDILTSIDRSNSLVYANELELQSFFYGGGLLTSSRSFCVNKNGKIFTRAEATKWKDSTFITSMYGENINDYEPLINMGGYGCRHTPDWITQDIAKVLKPDNNAKAVEKNKAFKDRNSL
jgi:hypothetical protein